MRVAVLAIALAGCAGNAVLELEVELPASADSCGSVALGLEARIATECLFDQLWFDGDAAVLAIDDAPSVHDVSLIAEGADVDRMLCLRARGCADTSACPLADVASGIPTRIEIPRAFYLGQYTALTIPIAPCASDAITIDPCDVEGCAGGAPRETFCEDGRHLCE